jgi:hypothetical protein
MEQSEMQVTPCIGDSEEEMIFSNINQVALPDIIPMNGTKTSTEELEMIENILLFMGISLGAYIGSFIRIGVTYYKIWKTETNYVSYSKHIGCQ